MDFLRLESASETEFRSVKSNGLYVVKRRNYQRDAQESWLLSIVDPVVKTTKQRGVLISDWRSQREHAIIGSKTGSQPPENMECASPAIN